MEKKIDINRALPAQAIQFSDLAFRSKAYWGYSDDFMAQCRAELTYSTEDFKNNICYYSVKNNQTVGFYILKSINQTECELDALFIEPKLIGNGHGRELFDHGRQTAKNSGFKKISIQSDPNSVEFYLAVGAVITGSKPSLSIPGRILPMLEFLI